MKIEGKVYCFFEQSGTFKNEFKKLGYEAEDFDIQNEFGETDNVIDLFNEIETEYDNLQATGNYSIRSNQSLSRPYCRFFPLYLL